MTPLQINRINNFYFDPIMKRITADKIEKLPISIEEIYSVKSRLKGAYSYEKDLITDLYNRGIMNQATFLTRMNEVSTRYIKRLKKNGVSIN